MFSIPAKRIGTNCYKWDAHKGTIPFGVADSDYKVALSIRMAMHRRVRQGAFGYSITSDDYFPTVARWIEDNYDYKVYPDQITCTSGIVFAINFIARTFLSEGDKVVIQPPVYTMFNFILNTCKMEVLENNLIRVGNTFAMDFEDLENKFRQGAKMFILCNPHNPTGNVWSESDIAKIVSLCKQYNVILVSDEIHCDLILWGNKFCSAGKFLNEYSNIIICNAPSKTFNIAGLGTSNIIFNNMEYKQRFDKVLTDNFCNINDIMGRIATVTAYTKCKDWLIRQNQYIEGNYNYLKSFLAKYMPQANVVDMQGTYLAFIDFTYLGLDDKSLEKLFLDYGVSSNYGTAYGKKFDGWMRLNLACPRSLLRKGLKRIAQACDSLRTTY